MPRKTASLLRVSKPVHARLKVAVPFVGKMPDGKDHDQHTTADLLLTEAMNARRIPKLSDRASASGKGAK